MSSRRRRGLLIISIVLAPFIVGLLLTYQILKIPFPTDMAEQPSVGYQAGPRILPAKDAVPIQGLAVDPDGVAANPIPADEISLQRGPILYNSIVVFWEKWDNERQKPQERKPERCRCQLSKPRR